MPIPATRQHAKRVDYEYERAGTANIFMFAEPLAGWRKVAVRETKPVTAKPPACNGEAAQDRLLAAGAMN